jgi:hypothetical protein
MSLLCRVGLVDGGWLLLLMGRDRFCLVGAVIGDGGGRDRRFGYLFRFGLEAGRFREFVCAGVEASVSSFSVVAGVATVSSSSLVSVSSEVAVSCRKLGSSAISSVVSSDSAGAKVGAKVGAESWRWSASSFDMSSVVVVAAVVPAASLSD